MNADAVVLQAPEQLALRRLTLDEPRAADIVVDIEWSAISTGTERLLWNGRMPAFPGMGYPLVPGYESVGRVTWAGPDAGIEVGSRVFVPGARCFGDVRGLFGGAASRVVLPAARTVAVGDVCSNAFGNARGDVRADVFSDTQSDALGEQAVLLALAATAHHVIGLPTTTNTTTPTTTTNTDRVLPELIIGHGVLGRLIARLVVHAGGAPVVWESNPDRRGGAAGYTVVDPAADPKRDYRSICDVSGDAGLLDTLISRLAPGGEVVLAGFYETPLSFVFAPAFMREARIRVAAQWQPADLLAVRDLAAAGRLSFDGLITHRSAATDADRAYRTAFGDADCLKMILDWRH